MASNRDIVLYHYSFSPYARRVVWYLNFRGISYQQCMQPPVMPREDLAALGVRYRRIPVLAIGRDVYFDTRLILQKFEEQFPHGRLGASSPDSKALEKLLEKWIIDAGIFARFSQLIPTDMPMLKDQRFQKDREDFSGRSWSEANMRKNRPEALAVTRDAFTFLESTLLADGREWILKTERPSLADIEAVWPFHWLNGLKGALPPDLISANQYPKVFAWIKRFDAAASSAKLAAGNSETLKGTTALRQIMAAGYFETEKPFDMSDPLGLKPGQNVEVWPIDSGSSHHDFGKLVSLDTQEVVFESQLKVGGKSIRIHAPRNGFRVRASSDVEAKL